MSLKCANMVRRNQSEFSSILVCLPCLDRLAKKKGLDISNYLEGIQFIGMGKTIVLYPSKVYHYRMRKSKKV